MTNEEAKDYIREWCPYDRQEEIIKALEQELKILDTLNFAIDASNGDTNYFVGFRNGLRYSKSLIDGKEPQFESCAEQEPCEDCINRQAVLSMQYRIDDSATLSTRDVVNVDDIEDLPPVTPKPKTGHWIPVSERMPEVDDEYIITIRERWGEDEEWDYETTTAFYSGKWSPSYDVDEGQEWEVIAWMPLPKPYKPTDSEKEQYGKTDNDTN